MTSEQPANPSPEAAFAPNPPGMSAIFGYIRPHTAHDVIERSLQHRQQASQSARDALNAAIDNSRIQLDGFRKPSKAPPANLVEHVLLEIARFGNDKLAGAALDVWKDASSDLAALVTSVLTEENIPVLGAKRDQFDALHPADAVHNAVDQVLDKQADSGPDYDQALLMLAYLSGRYPHQRRSDSPLFSDWLDHLEFYHPGADEWDEVPNFIAQLKEMAAQKIKGRGEALREDVADALAAIATNFTSELQFLEIDPPEQNDNIDALPDRAKDALSLIDGLQAALANFASVRPQAPTASEEQQRAEQRNIHGESIRSLVADWRELIERAAVERAEAQSPEEPPALSDSAEIERLEAANASLRAGHDRLAQEKVALDNEKSRLNKDLADHQQSYDRLRMEKDDQAEENSRLRRENRELTEKLETLRLGIRPKIEGENPEVPIPSVPAAIDVARQIYEPDRLIIKLNSRSQPETPYKRPREVYLALEWLATEYYDLRTNPPGADPEYDRHLKEVCNGWFFSPKQSMTAKGKYPEEYKTTVNGKAYPLDAHIGEGTKGDPRNMIRIAFAWDEDLAKVIVGYIGPHQRTQAS